MRKQGYRTEKGVGSIMMVISDHLMMSSDLTHSKQNVKTRLRKTRQELGDQIKVMTVFQKSKSVEDCLELTLAWLKCERCWE